MEKIIINTTFKKDSSFDDIIQKIKRSNDLLKFIYEKRGEELTITIEETITTDSKRRMYNYLNGVLIPFLIKLKRDQGEALDKAECLVAMKMLFAKDVMQDHNGDNVLVLLSQSDMSKSRLITFINDIIHHIEEDYGVKAPDSEEYKLMKLNFLTNRKFKKV